VTGPDLAAAAVIGGADREAQAIVERELAAAGIACWLEGTVVYTIHVPTRDLARARQVLRSSADLKDHWIQFPPSAEGVQ
jgi:hypothetical protein